MTIGELGASDGPAYRALLEGADAEERYFRFFRPVHEITSALVEGFVEQNAGALGLLARDSSGRPLAIANAALDDDGRRAELGILVARKAQQKGLGKILVGRLIEELVGRGCGLLVARSLEENVAFAQLARSVGMRVAGHDLGVLTWELPFVRMRARMDRVA